MPTFEPVTAFVRGLQVLQALNALRCASLAQLKAATALPKSTILRMLETLVAEGFVARDLDAPVYRVTGKCLSLSDGFDAHANLRRVAEPLLAEFSERVGWPADLGAFDHDAMTIFPMTHDRGSVLVVRNGGSRAPMLQSTLGRAYLANRPEAEQNRILDRLQALPWAVPNELTERGAVMEMLRLTRQRGYATPDSAYVLHHHRGRLDGLGVPVLGRHGAIGAISLAFLTDAVPAAEAAERYAPMLQDLARDVALAAERNSLLPAMEGEAG